MKNILTLAIVLILTFTSKAQNTPDTPNASTVGSASAIRTGKNEIGICRGFNLAGFGVSLNRDNYIDHSYRTITIHYRHFVSRHITYGLSACFIETNDNGSGDNSSFYALTPEVGWSYYNPAVSNNKLQPRLYGLMSMGFIFVTSESYYSAGTSQNILLSTFQVTPIGMRVGKSFGGFVELGFGLKGLVNVGIDVRMR